MMCLRSESATLTPSLPYMTEISVVIRPCMSPYMTEISVGFTIVIPGSVDPGKHFGLEVKRLRIFLASDDIETKSQIFKKRYILLQNIVLIS